MVEDQDDNCHGNGDGAHCHDREKVDTYNRSNLGYWFVRIQIMTCHQDRQFGSIIWTIKPVT